MHELFKEEFSSPCNDTQESNTEPAWVPRGSFSFDQKKVCSVPANDPSG
jgi:hypothetical protein